MLVKPVLNSFDQQVVDLHLIRPRVVNCVALERFGCVRMKVKKVSFRDVFKSLSAGAAL